MPPKKQSKQKRPSLMEDPPTASSSESEEEQQTPSLLKPVQEEASSDDDEEASSEEQVPQPVSKSPVANPIAANSNPKPSESESESDSDQAPAPPSANPKSKSKPKSQIQPSPSSTPAKSAAKRPAEDNGDAKRAKKKKGAVVIGSDEEKSKMKGAVVVGSDEEKSKRPFQKVWSDVDEITIVKGLADLMSSTGKNPMMNTDAFYDSIKNSLLRVGTNASQVKEKIRRLKLKFQTLAGKGKNGEDPIFTSAHEQELFQWSKKVWGKRGAVEAVQKPKSNVKKSKPKTNPELESDMQVDTADSSLLLREMFRVSELNEDVVKKGVELIGASKRAELEGKWKKLQVTELELFVERAELIEEMSRLVLEACKSNN